MAATRRSAPLTGVVLNRRRNTGSTRQARHVKSLAKQFIPHQQRTSSQALRQTTSPNYAIESLLATGGFSEVFVGRYKESSESNNDPYKVAIKICQVQGEQEEKLEEEEGEGEVEGEVRSSVRDEASVDSLNVEVGAEETLLVPPNRAAPMETILNEIEMLRRLSPSQHISRYIESFSYRTDHAVEVWIVMELLSVDLQTVHDLCWDEDRLSSDQVRTISLQTLEALRYMHKKRVVHRDLKLSNILLSSTGVIKLCDFGIARLLPRAGAPPLKVDKRVGTLGYMAPELLHPGQTYNEQVDVWAFGVMLYILTEGGDIRPSEAHRDLPNPFSAETWEAYASSNREYFKVLLGEHGFEEAQDTAIGATDETSNMNLTNVRQQYWKLLKDCWGPLPLHGVDGGIQRPNLLRRATVGQLLKSPYFGEFDASELTDRNHITTAVKNYQKAMVSKATQWALDTSTLSDY